MNFNQKQIDNITIVLDEATKAGWNTAWKAYLLATMFWETDRTMCPINEKGSASYFLKYEQGSLARMLGNTQPGDGAKFKGRGFVQITGRSNYLKASKFLGVDCVANTDLMLDSHYSADVTINFCEKGMFTGVGFARYLGPKTSALWPSNDQFIQCRRVINGLDKADTIASFVPMFKAYIEKLGETLV